MKRTIIFFLMLCGAIIAATAQSVSTPVRISEVEKDQELYGFIRENGTIVVSPKHIHAHDFSEGLAAVKDTNNRWGFINTAGKKVFTLPSNVSEVGDFSEGLCWFRDSKTDKVGFVDRTGKVVIRPQWGFAHDFSDGLAAVGNGRTRSTHWFEIGSLLGYINHKGETVIPLNIRHSNYGSESFSCHRAVIKTDTGMTIIDTKGNELYGGKYRCSEGRFSHMGLCCVAEATNEPCDEDGDNGLPPCKLHWCVIDTTGRVVLDNVKTGSFINGLSVMDLSQKSILYLDEENTVSVRDGKFIFIDTTGKNVFGRSFLQANTFSEGLAYVKEMDGTEGYINPTGEMVLRLPEGYTAFYSPSFSHGLVKISKSTKKGKYTYHNEQVIDRNGNTVWETSYQTWFP